MFFFQFTAPKLDNRFKKSLHTIIIQYLNPVVSLVNHNDLTCGSQSRKTEHLILNKGYWLLYHKQWQKGYKSVHLHYRHLLRDCWEYLPIECHSNHILQLGEYLCLPRRRKSHIVSPSEEQTAHILGLHRPDRESLK